MSWETPSYSELNMSAEIGGYQDDFETDRGRGGDPGPYRAGLTEAAAGTGNHTPA